MNNEMQLTNTAPAGDYWTAGQNAIAAPAATASSVPPRSPMRKAHRLLRGRYPLAIVLATAGAVVGAGAGFTLLAPKFESVGRIQISAQITSTNTVDSTIPMYTAYMTSQAAMFSGTRAVEQAIDSKQFQTAWARAYHGAPLPSVADFVLALDAEYVKNSDMIKIAFDDKEKIVAEAGARSIVSAYMQLYGSGLSGDRKRKIDFLQNQQTELNYTLSVKRAALADLSTQYGTTDLTVQHNSSQEELARLQSDLSQAKIAYDTAKVAAGQASPVGNGTHELMLQQIAAVDPEMRTLMLQRQQNELALEDVSHRYGPRHDYYIAQQGKVSDSTRMIDDYARDYMIRHGDRIPVAADDQSNPYNLETLKAKMDSLQKQADIQKIDAFAVGSTREKIEQLRTEIDDLQTSLHNTANRIEALQSEQQLAANVNIIEPGTDAVIASDKRKLGAAIGFVFGSAIPVAILMAFGMFDDRFRYSDDAGEADLAGVTLLGILPNLPDRLSDPQQAGIAAHCVHQIRTMLQINRSNDEPQVLAVTSAAPADGKTSLTLALGLSYAACGARTLLIDCDLVAAGLTHRLNVSSTEGVLEAVANRALLEFVRTTDIADVAILPVGTTHAHHASTLSPVSLRRLLSEAKKHFDIVLVDTGPILGSIEASLVCAAADRTILTVARGQQRPLVERSIGHLQAISARLAGVVFNRAQARDFEKSMSGLALRSRPTMAAAAAGGSGTGSFKRTA